MIQNSLEKLTSDMCINLLKAKKVPVGLINNISAALNDEQVITRQMVQEVKHKTLGVIKQLGPVAKYSETPATIYSAPPILGEHTELILQEELGYSKEEIKKLRIEKVI